MVNMMITMNDKQTNIADNNQVGILVNGKITSIYVNGQNVSKQGNLNGM